MKDYLTHEQLSVMFEDLLEINKVNKTDKLPEKPASNNNLILVIE